MSHSTAEAGELSPRDPVEGRGHRQVAPVEGKTANTPRLGPVSTSRQRIAELARQALGMAVAIAWLPGPAGTRRRVAKPSVEEPDAAEPARPDLWGARVSNDPGLPDRAGAPKREGEMLTASRERGVIGCREIDAQHPEDRGQEALGLTQRSVEDETERQGGFDGEIGILELPAPPADASRCPRGDRVRREPESDVASPHEGSVVLGPVPDAIRCLVLRMHSRLHIEIMTRLRSRWSTCRPLLAHRAESAHQRRSEGRCTLSPCSC